MNLIVSVPEYIVDPHKTEQNVLHGLPTISSLADTPTGCKMD